MRPLELSLASLLALHLLATALLSRRQSRLPALLALAAAALALLQLLLEGYRWQMLFLYAYSAAIALQAGRRGWAEEIRPAPASRQMGIMLLAGFALSLAVILPALLPVPHFPPPTGPYAVGTFSFPLVDKSRAEIYGAAPGGPRRLMVQVWYPAAMRAGATPAPWMEHLSLQIPALARTGGVPAFLFSQLRYVKTNSFSDLPLAPDRERYPLLHFSHGYSGFRSQATFLTEELASHGYVVVSSEHPYAALNTIFPDGSAIPFDPDTLPEEAPDDVYEAAAQRLLRQWVADTRFVHDFLAQGAESGPAARLAGRLDLERVGLLGHSTGGAAALQFCAQDGHCRAAVALDPWMLPLDETVVERGMAQPLLVMSSDAEMAYFPPANEDRVRRFVDRAGNLACSLALAGSGHHDFDDTGAFSPAARLFGYNKGPIAIERAFTAVRAYTLAFLDQMLIETGAGFEPPSGRFPEVRWECIGAQ